MDLAYIFNEFVNKVYSYYSLFTEYLGYRNTLKKAYKMYHYNNSRNAERIQIYFGLYMDLKTIFYDLFNEVCLALLFR